MLTISLERQAEPRLSNNAVRFITSALVVIISIMLMSLIVYAGDDGLTGILTSDEVRGSQKYLGFMSWYGVIANAVISVVCLLGLVQSIVTFIATLTYYAAPAYWDYVASLKEGQAGLMNGNIEGLTAATGFDALIDAANSLNVNVKRYSDASTEFDSNLNIDEYTTGWEYLMKKGPVLFMAILLLNMGWKGTLQTMLAATVDAVTVYAEALPYQKLVDFAEWKAAQETGYDFVLGLSGTEEGKVKEKLARTIFDKVQGTMRYTAKEDIIQLGSNIEGYVAGIEDHFELPKHMTGQKDGAGSVITANTAAPEIWKQLSITVGVSSSTNAQNVNEGVYIKFASLISGCDAKSSKRANDTSITNQYIIIAMKYRDYSDDNVFKSNKPWVTPTKKTIK